MFLACAISMKSRESQFPPHLHARCAMSQAAPCCTCVHAQAATAPCCVMNNEGRTDGASAVAFAGEQLRSGKVIHRRGRSRETWQLVQEHVACTTSVLIRANAFEKCLFIPCTRTLRMFIAHTHTHTHTHRHTHTPNSVYIACTHTACVHTSLCSCSSLPPPCSTLEQHA